LWRLDVSTGHQESLLAGFAINGYDISLDEQQVAFITEGEGTSQIWIAPLDRHEPPKQLVRGGDEAAFDGAGNVFFRSLGTQANYLHRMRADGSGNIRVLDKPIVEFHAVAPDGKHVAVDLPVEGGLAGAWFVALDTGASRLVRNGWWPSRWSKDGRQLYMEVGTDEQSARHGRTAILDIGSDGFPNATTMTLTPDAAQIPHAELALSVGTNPFVYAFEKGEVRRNIYRVPLH
jgi:hypothetical protein